MFGLVCLLLALTFGSTQGNSDNITVSSPAPVTLYYESMCPYSVRFILNKLVPTYNEKDFNFAELLSNLTLVPYGHVYNADPAKYEYKCQHGVPECEGNKLHGCAVKHIEDKSILLNYISCLMNETQNSMNPVLSYPANECKNLVPDNKMLNIFKCYNSNEGWDLFNQHGTATMNFFGLNQFYVPYVSFHNVKDDNLSSIAKGNFKKTLCVKNKVQNIACTDS